MNCFHPVTRWFFYVDKENYSPQLIPFIGISRNLTLKKCLVGVNPLMMDNKSLTNRLIQGNEERKDN